MPTTGKWNKHVNFVLTLETLPGERSGSTVPFDFCPGFDHCVAVPVGRMSSRAVLAIYSCGVCGVWRPALWAICWA